MGEAKRRREQGLPPRTVRLPPLEIPEVQVLHHLMHRRLDELGAMSPEEAGEAAQQELRILQALHHKLFQH